MRRNTIYLFPIIQVLIFIFTCVSPDSYVELSIMLTAVVVLSILTKLGNGIVLRELICLHGCVFCLLMPCLGYEWYDITNSLSRLWVSYMKVNAHDYFTFALPAITGFTVTLSWPVKKMGTSDQGEYLSSTLQKARVDLKNNPHIGLVLVIVGIFALYLSPLVPEALQYPFNLMYLGSYAGVLYIYFNKDLPYRKIAIIFFVLFVVIKALGGMFTEVAYMSVVVFSFLFIGKKTSLIKKVLAFCIGFFFIIVLQSVKTTYRKSVWLTGYSGNKAELFVDLATQKLSNPSALFDKTAFFPLYARFNQGFNVAMVIKRFPALVPFDQGSNLMINAFSSLVPRFLWPDKPLAGGKFNMKYYAGFVIDKWSTNVGPLGEAYGSFGANGGIIFMILLGSFVRWCYQRFFYLSKNLPLLIFWLPLLFYQVTYSMETDTLQILNSLMKGSFFLWMLYKLVPSIFGKVKNISSLHFKRVGSSTSFVS